MPSVILIRAFLFSSRNTGLVLEQASQLVPKIATQYEKTQQKKQVKRHAPSYWDLPEEIKIICQVRFKEPEKDWYGKHDQAKTIAGETYRIWRQ